MQSTSGTGLEDGVEHMEIEKEKSDDDWMIADPVPLTETDMVGSLLQEQEAKDREQYVFLTQEDADMGTVHDHLSALTEHIHRLSVGEPTETVEGPQTDGPKRVEVEPAGDGLFRLTCFPEPFPHVSRYVSSLLGVAQLFDVFRGKPLTRAGVYVKATDKRGIGYGELRFDAEGTYHSKGEGSRRKRRMPPWWMFRPWPKHHRPAWIQWRLHLQIRCRNPSTSSSENRW